MTVRTLPVTWLALAAVALSALLLLPAAARAGDCAFADAEAGQATAAQLDQSTLCLLDQERTRRGLEPLTASGPLAETATKYSSYMVANRHFDHVDLAGHNVLDRVGADAPSLLDRLRVVGENLGWGTYELSTPREMVGGWMNSPGHRQNILYPGYQIIGIGVVGGAPRAGESNALTYTTVFGKLAGPARPAGGRRPSGHRHRTHGARAARGPGAGVG
jgi:uncharacterized protein YkwD